MIETIYILIKCPAPRKRIEHRIITISILSKGLPIDHVVIVAQLKTVGQMKRL